MVLYLAKITTILTRILKSYMEIQLSSMASHSCETEFEMKDSRPHVHLMQC